MWEKILFQQFRILRSRFTQTNGSLSLEVTLSVQIDTQIVCRVSERHIPIVKPSEIIVNDLFGGTNGGLAYICHYRAVERSLGNSKMRGSLRQEA